MGLCPVDCAPVELIKNPVGQCVSDFRRKTPSRIFFYSCQTVLPIPVTGSSIKPLFDNGDIVSTVELANFAFDTPTSDDLQISDCRPAVKLITSRTITFEDRTGIVAVQGSPGVENKFADYDFWLNKLINWEQLNYMIAYCDGDVIIPVDLNGKPLYASLSGFIDFQRAQQAGGPSTELKKFTITFNFDPLYFNNKPAFNYIDAGIVL